ncbi:hypothetical protein GCM10010275_19450 [Streptomyces litmocidini]|uniref:hypothetical protein n=1 Tax=Streptomyces litmocidini TaxID=67318 RepID=UPI00167D7B95|nr:hypothetical protein [Streptomyces litmocidini]GGU84504.1 hypothetical protein GCM10010275_19450 [Streptomyces litmocidini]
MSFRRFRRRQERTCSRELAAVRILDDLRRWRDAHNRRTCRAIWQLPTYQPTRKETGQ